MTTNLTTKREEIKQEFDKQFIDSGHAWIGGKYRDFKFSAHPDAVDDFFDQALKSYGEEVRQVVIEEIESEIRGSFWLAYEAGLHDMHDETMPDANTRFKSEYLKEAEVSLEKLIAQLRSTQPKEEKK